MTENDENLKLLCVPPLGSLLGIMEQKKDSPLTQAEVEKIAGNSVCVALHEEEYWQMLSKQENAHIDPGNAWDDWQRYKSDYGFGFMPEIVLAIPGNDEFKAKATDYLSKQTAVNFEFKDADPQYEENCKDFSFRSEHPFTEEELEQVRKHTCIAIIRNQGSLSKSAHLEAARFMKLGQELLDLGGLALSVESTNIYHSKTNWGSYASIIQNCAPDSDDYWAYLLNAYVLLPVTNQNDCHSIGMHLLGKPDMVASLSVLEKSHESKHSQTAAMVLFDQIGYYQLTEGQTRPFASGHTFQLSLESPIFRLTWEKCTQYNEGNIYFNPYGMWRFDLLNEKESKSILKKFSVFFKK